MAAKAVRKATKPRGAKKAKRRATRRAARKARRAAKPKAPKAARKATKPRAPKAASKPKKAKKVTKKVRKPKRVSKMALRKRQTGSFRRVWSGTAMYTKGGLMKKDLCMNKRGKVVSKKKSAQSKKANTIGPWLAAVVKARKELGITGFCTINKGEEGVALYKKAQALYK